MDWIALSAVSGAVVAGGTVSVFIFRHLHPRLVAFRQFWERVVGVTPNPVTGQERIPGLFEEIKALRDQNDRLEARLEERLDQQDGVLAAQDRVLETIRHEVEFNNGSSVKDAAVRTERKVKEIADTLDAHLKGGTP
jgi:hypothetical protein